jgi:hypothetical protein
MFEPETVDATPKVLVTMPDGDELNFNGGLMEVDEDEGGFLVRVVEGTGPRDRGAVLVLDLSGAAARWLVEELAGRLGAVPARGD